MDAGDTIKVTVAIVAIATLQSLAIVHGMNGTLLAGAMTIIGGLGGYTISRARMRK